MRSVSRTRTRTTAVDTLASRTTPPGSITIHGCAAAANADPSTIGMTRIHYEGINLQEENRKKNRRHRPWVVP